MNFCMPVDPFVNVGILTGVGALTTPVCSAPQVISALLRAWKMKFFLYIVTTRPNIQVIRIKKVITKDGMS